MMTFLVDCALTIPSVARTRLKGTKQIIDADYVRKRMHKYDPLAQDDLSRYIL